MRRSFFLSQLASRKRIAVASQLFQRMPVHLDRVAAPSRDRAFVCVRAEVETHLVRSYAARSRSCALSPTSASCVVSAHLPPMYRRRSFCALVRLREGSRG